MSLPGPILDDRSYEQLRDELVRRIPVYAPEWTDHNASDPGITLVELFAFLGENLLYRFNQIPETTRLEFLRLLQIPLRPGEAAKALLSLSTKEISGVLVPLGSEAKAGRLSFETQTEARVLPVSSLAVAKQACEFPDAASEPELHDAFVRTQDAFQQTQSPGDDPVQPICYENQIVPLDGAGLPVDFDEAVDGMLWVAVLAAGDTDPQVLRDALTGHDDAPLRLNLGFVPDETALPSDEVRPCPGEGTSNSVAAVQWQISTGRFAADDPSRPVYLNVRVDGDTTNGLSDQGVVRLSLPADPTDMGLFQLDDPDLGGTGDLPPQLDDATEAKLVFWLRAFRHDASRFGKVLYVGANAVQTRQWRRARTEFLGTGNAQPNQTFPLVHKPVIDGSLEVEVEQAPNQWQRWRQVDGFHASGESDLHFELILESGLVRFGNGLRGYAPQIGQRIRARTYLYGGGSEGNVAPNAISKLTQFPAVKAANPLPARGGTDREPIDAALQRIPGELRRRDRAVTSGDFRELALQTPGADIGRAECLPRFHPQKPDVEAAGVVSVVVWPARDARHPGAPLPNRDQLRRVCRWLDQRRLVTTELYVIPPAYRKIAVAVGLQVKPGFGIDAVRLWVELVIRQYLAPLPPFGPSGEGWPLGRTVHGPELEAAALQVEGVQFLEGLQVAAWDPVAAEWVPGSVELATTEVPELAEISVVEGPPQEPGAAMKPPIDPGTPLPMPVVREEC